MKSVLYYDHITKYERDCVKAIGLVWLYAPPTSVSDWGSINLVREIINWDRINSAISSPTFLAQESYPARNISQCHRQDSSIIKRIVIGMILDSLPPPPLESQ